MLIGYGALIITASFIIDRRSNEDYAFWSYGFGATALWLGLTFLSKSELGFALYALGGVASMFASVLLSRRVFAITGGFAVLAYVGHVLMTYLGDSALLPVALTGAGALSIYLAIFYTKNVERIESAALRVVPEKLRRALPKDDDQE